MELTGCTVCPRKCMADRIRGLGFCGGGASVKVARAALHFWEEPCISGKNGSGTVFFSGCPLRCCFCQNHEISSGNFGKEISVKRLSEIFLNLQTESAHNINLVSPTHYAVPIIKALDAIKNDLHVPVVYNTSGYETVETLKALEGHVDIYLPDIKYFDPERSKKYSDAPDYFDAASRAVLEMFRQTGKAETDRDGILKKGLVIRHMVMPGGRKDSIKILRWIASSLPKDDILISIMSQYTPSHQSSCFPEINRPLTTLEYQSVISEADDLGLRGYMQEKSASDTLYIPSFDLEGVL